jgi:hypothetical protein
MDNDSDVDLLAGGDGDDDRPDQGTGEGDKPRDLHAMHAAYERLSPHERDEWWNNTLDDDDRAALTQAFDVAGPAHFDAEGFEVPTDTTEYSDARIRRAYDEGKAGAEAIAKGLIVVDEVTFEAAADLRHQIEQLAGQPRKEAVLKLDALVKAAREHHASIGTFDESRIRARDSWIDGFGRSHERQEDHRGRVREVVMTKAETDEAIKAVRSTQLGEVIHLPGASDDLIEGLNALNGNPTIDQITDVYVGLPRAEQTLFYSKLDREQQKALEGAITHRAERQQDAIRRAVDKLLGE